MTLEVTAKDKIWAEGYAAYENEEDCAVNPYDKYLTPAQYEIWEDGWYDAFNEEFPEVKHYE
jgi:hypothetical protein